MSGFLDQKVHTDYKYQMMDFMLDYSAKDMLLFYGNMEKQKLRSRTQPTLKIHDDQSRIPQHRMKNNLSILSKSL